MMMRSYENTLSSTSYLRHEKLQQMSIAASVCVGMGAGSLASTASESAVGAATAS
jgi:hypothetical protein